MSTQKFEIPAAPQAPKSIRISLPAALLAEIEELAIIGGIEPTAVIEHAVAFALATRKSKRTRTKRTITA
jgi:metal-responsive CopG/Arc/MetJ family transcriptional regulator